MLASEAPDGDFNFSRDVIIEVLDTGLADILVDVDIEDESMICLLTRELIIADLDDPGSIGGAAYDSDTWRAFFSLKANNVGLTSEFPRYMALEVEVLESDVTTEGGRKRLFREPTLTQVGSSQTGKERTHGVN